MDKKNSRQYFRLYFVDNGYNYKLLKISVLVLIATVLHSCDPSDQLGSGYSYDYSSRYLFTPNGYPDIPSVVIEYNYDDQFIIVRQNCFGRFPSIFDEDMPYFDRIPFRKDSTTFWILDKSTHWNSGPMDTISFSELCRDKGVTLKFKSDIPPEPKASFIEKISGFLFPDKFRKYKE